MGIRTGIIKIIYPDTTIPGLAPVPMASFEVKGNTALLEVKITGGGCGSLTFTAEKSIDREATYAKVIDRNSPWSMTVTEVNAPGLYIFELQGLKMFPVDFMRLSYQAEIQAGDVEVRVFNYQETGGASVYSSIGDVIADMGDIDTNTKASAASLAVIQEYLESISMFVQACNDSTEFAAVSDAQNLADDTEHVTGTVSVEWDKTGGSDVISGVDDTLGAALDLSRFTSGDYITACFYIPDLTNVAKVHIQIGTDNANFTEWEWADTALTTGWNLLFAKLSDYASITGTGMQQNAVVYVQAAVEFDNAANTLNDMKVDHIALATSESMNNLSTAAMVALLTTINADTGASATSLADIKIAIELLADAVEIVSKSVRTRPIAPVENKAIPQDVVDDVNLAAATHFFPSATGAATLPFKDLSFTGKLIDGDGTITMTFEGTNDEDRVTGDWQPVTPSGYRTDENEKGNISITVTNATELFAIDFDNFNYDYWRWRIVCTGATNTVVVKQREKAL